MLMSSGRSRATSDASMHDAAVRDALMRHVCVVEEYETPPTDL